jgi:hypothetical protein
MNFYILVVIIIFGLLINYLIMVSHIRKLRNNGEGFKKGEILASAIFFGGPVLLLYNIYSDVRLDDEKHYFLIFGIVYTILQALLVFLLIYFRVIIFS